MTPLKIRKRIADYSDCSPVQVVRGGTRKPKMQTPQSHWTAGHAALTGAHGVLLDEPMRSLLQLRLDDLERRLVGMSQAIALMRRQPPATQDETTDRTRPEFAALAEVRAARARLEAGSYGLCATCDAPIEQHRLAGRPQVLQCGFCELQARRS